MTNLSKEEKELLDSVERGEWKSVSNFEKEKKKAMMVARETLKKNRCHVKVFDSGRIVMTPRVLARPEELSKNTLRMIYSSIRNLKKGKAGSTVEFKKYKKKSGYAKVKLSNLPSL